MLTYVYSTYVLWCWGIYLHAAVSPVMKLDVSRGGHPEGDLPSQDDVIKHRKNGGLGRAVLLNVKCGVAVSTIILLGFTASNTYNFKWTLQFIYLHVLLNMFCVYHYQCDLHEQF